MQWSVRRDFCFHREYNFLEITGSAAIGSIVLNSLNHPLAPLRLRHFLTIRIFDLPSGPMFTELFPSIWNFPQNRTLYIFQICGAVEATGFGIQNPSR
jgi:hypothetical protein